MARLELGGYLALERIRPVENSQIPHAHAPATTVQSPPRNNSAPRLDHLKARRTRGTAAGYQAYLENESHIAALPMRGMSAYTAGVLAQLDYTAIAGVLEDSQSIRYAICLRENDRYIGNVQLTSLSAASAEFHIFIGEPDYWKRGIGGRATASLPEIARDELALRQIYLTVDKRNQAAVEIYLRRGFVWLGDKMVRELA